MNELKSYALTALAYSLVCSVTSWVFLVADAQDYSSDADFFIWLGAMLVLIIGYPYVENKLLGNNAGRNERLRFGVMFFTLSVPLSLINLYLGTNIIFGCFYPESAKDGFLAGIEFSFAALAHELLFAAAIVVRLIWALIKHVRMSCAAMDKKKLLHSAELLIWGAAGIYVISLVISFQKHSRRDRLGTAIFLIISVLAMLLAAFIRIVLTRFTPDGIHTAIVTDNLYLCSLSSLTIHTLEGSFIAEYAAAMIFLNLLLLIKAPEPELDELKPTWVVTAIIQASGLLVILTS